jgi:hypothetical protein
VAKSWRRGKANIGPRGIGHEWVCRTDDSQTADHDRDDGRANDDRRHDHHNHRTSDDDHDSGTPAVDL